MGPELSPQLQQYVDVDELDALIERARREDLGPTGIDVTATALIEAGRRCDAAMVPRTAGVLAGAELLPRIAAGYDSAIQAELHRSDGDALTPGDPVTTFTGPLRSILMMERVALNFVTHLSGVASQTAHLVRAVAETAAGIYDTRKTLPGLRGLEKYAVVCGGGRSHRGGLYDAMLIKDNHIAHLSLDELPAALGAAIDRARIDYPGLSFVEIEVDTLEQLRRVLPLPIDIALLDNMGPDQLAQAVALRDELAPGVALEASGGIDLETVGPIAAAGVDRIAVGGLTHSAPALDLGLDLGLGAQ